MLTLSFNKIITKKSTHQHDIHLDLRPRWICFVLW